MAPGKRFSSIGWVLAVLAILGLVAGGLWWVQRPPAQSGSTAQSGSAAQSGSGAQESKAVRGIIDPQPSAPSIKWRLAPIDLQGSRCQADGQHCSLNLVQLPSGNLLALSSVVHTADATTESALAAVDRSTGRTLWTSPVTPGETSCDVEPLTEVVICTRGAGVQQPGHVDLVDGATGQARQIASFPGQRSALVQRLGSAVYVVTSDRSWLKEVPKNKPLAGTITRFASDGSAVWNTSFETLHGVSGLALNAGKLYPFYTHTPAGRVLAFDEATGRIVADTQRGAFIGLREGQVISREGPLSDAEEGVKLQPAIRADGTPEKEIDLVLDAWDTSDGLPRLTIEFASTEAELGLVRARAAGTSDTVLWSKDGVDGAAFCAGRLLLRTFEPSGARRMSAIDPTSGKVLWETAAGEWPSYLTLCDGSRFVTAEDGKLLGIDAASGRVAWSLLVGDAPLRHVLEGAAVQHQGFVVSDGQNYYLVR